MSAFTNRCTGLIITKNRLCNPNADFSGFPNSLPSIGGEAPVLYASSYSMKYAIRKYWKNVGKDVFVRKTLKKEEEKFDKGKIIYLPNTLNDRYNNVKREGESAFEVIARHIDTKLFGVTLTLQQAKEPPKNKKEKGKNSKKKEENSEKKEEDQVIALTGAIQIHQGINRYSNNEILEAQMLSPYASKDGKKQSTIGQEIRVQEAYYVYTFTVNPQNSYEHYEDHDDIKRLLQITQEDIADLKEALKYAITNHNTCSKIGSENICVMFITQPENSMKQIPLLSDYVNITKEGGKAVIDLSKVTDIFNELDKDEDEFGEKETFFEKIEIFYNTGCTEVKNAPAEAIKTSL